MIKRSLDATKTLLGVSEVANWTGRLYQFANRLAHVSFLQEHTRLPVWLVNICFTLDRRTPHSKEAWLSELKTIKKELGWPTEPVPRSVDVFLAARERKELLAPAGLSSPGHG
jgi:hypothetical protein